MKKLKIWLIAMVAIITSVTLTSCGDDDKKGDEPSTGIAGTYEYFETYNGNVYEGTLTLTKDGTFTSVESTLYSESGNKYEGKASGTYTVAGLQVELKCVKVEGDHFFSYPGDTKTFIWSPENNSLNFDGDIYLKK